MAKATEFGGRIGRDWRDSEPWWPPDPSAPEGAPNVVLIVLDDVGFAQFGCYGSDIATPTIDGLAAGGDPAGQLPHDGPVLAHPGLPPDRPQPPSQRHGPRGRPGLGLPRLLGQAAHGERLPVGDPPCERLRHLRRGEVAPHARRTRPTWRPPGRHGPSAGASTAGTASTGARRTSSSPPSTTTTTASGPARSIEDGYHLSADLADRAIEFLGDLRAVDARPAVLPLLLHRGLPLAPPGAAPVDRPLPGPLRRRLGRLAGADLRPSARPRG